MIELEEQVDLCAGDMIDLNTASYFYILINGNNPPHNNVLIRSGEVRLVGWSRSMLYSGFNTLPRSVFWSAYFNGRSDNTDVIPLDESLVDANSATENTRRPFSFWIYILV